MVKRQKLIVDGYNMIGAWPPLVRLQSQKAIEDARDMLLALLASYSAYHGYETWVVFDAMFVPGLSQTYAKYGMHVVFTAEGETADSYIESMIKNMVGVLTDVTVATSDLLEQRLILQQGALRQSALELWRDVQQTQNQIRRGEIPRSQDPMRRLIPWSYQELTLLKGLLDDLSKEN